MARKTDEVSPAKALAQIKSLRSSIDKLDAQILKTINERAGLAAEIGRIKVDNGTEVFNPAREEEVFQHVLQLNKGPLDEGTIRAVFREIMSGARALQKVIKVAYLGPEYSYSHLAAVERFGQAVEFMRVGSISSVFEEVNRGHVDFGVVPLENSTDGGVSETLDMFMRLPQLKIGAEVRLQIHHNLLANCEQEQIRRVYSKPQALSQCRNWLSKNLPHADLKDVSSTAIAAQLAAQEPGAAAVASRQAAVKYSLRILFPDIQDYQHNETRFAVIGHQAVARTGTDKTAMMFRVPHKAGSLVTALETLNSAKLSMTWIESFPAKTGPNEYIFFVEVEGHQEDPKVKKALTALGEYCDELCVLGSFPVATVAG
jgi:chorismate mutase/prephenate dehydratase